MISFKKWKMALSITSLALSSLSANAQLINCNAFLQGKFIEVGVNSLGSYGSSVAAPAGYHPRGSAGVYNTCTGIAGPSGTALGFVADPDKDGWTVGTPAYMGDYFLPGSPYEGWIIEVNGSKAAQNNGATSSLGGITSVTNSGSQRSATWQGTHAGLSIKQVTSFDTANLYFTCNVTLKNTTGATLNNVYYLRGVDPDNEVPVGGSYTTNNSVVYKLPNALGATLVAGVGQTYGAYLGLGTLDPRAKAYITPSWPPSPPLSTVYAGASGFTYTGSLNGDYGMGVVFNIGSVAPGDSTSFVFTYILKGSDFLAALLATSSNWSATGDTAFSHKSDDTANICQFAATTVTINNPTPHTYAWTSLTGESLSASSGSSVSVTAGTTLVRLMAIGTATGQPNDTTYINLNPVFATPSAPTAGSNSPVCQGATLSLSATGGGSGVTYSWSGPASYSSSLQNPAITNVQLPSAGVYSVYAINGACRSTPATTIVSVNPAPVVSVTASASSVCSGSSVTLSATGAATYSWAGPMLTATTGASVVANPTVASTYTVVGTDAFGCTRSTTRSISMSSNVAAIGGASSVCQGASITLTDASTAGTWNSSDPAVATVGASGIVTGVTSGTAMISYAAATYCGIATRVVSVNAAPSVAPITGNTSFFAGYTTTLSSATPGGAWSSGNSAVAASIGSTGAITGLSAGFSTITYSVVGGGCTGRVITNVVVYNCGANTTLTFNYSGTNQAWTVPDGVTSIDVTLLGASGGRASQDSIYGNRAGRGGKVTGTLAVTPGQILNVYVGGKGANVSTNSTRSLGGFNGGGNGGGFGAGAGGGASDIRIGGTGLTDRIVVAGGGGANGYGYSGYGNAGDGGNTTGGTGGFSPSNPTGKGTGGTQSAGGLGGDYTQSGPTYVNYYGLDGLLGQGGDGSFYYGGGGGGGYYGGGGAGYDGGAGGGSSYADGSVSSVSMTSGFNTGNGLVQVSFSFPNIVIGSQPASTTVCAGTSASFSVAASMAITPNTLSYQWQVNTGSGFTDVPGATNNTLSLTPAASQNGEQYQVVVNGVCGQTATSDVVTLTVNTAPVITVCPGNISVNNDADVCDASVSYTAATVTGSAPTVTYTHPSGSAFPLGTTTVTVNASNSCGSTLCTFDVTVIDAQDPTITAPADVTVNANSGSCSATGYSLGTPATGDNCGVAGITNDDAGSYSVGTHNITWTTTDVNGRTATATQTITVVDNQNPVAVCKNYTLNLTGGTGTVAAADIDNGSSDNCSIATMTVSPATFTCSNAGTNTVTLTVTDASGNVSTCSSVVTVQHQPSASITVTPANTTYTGGIANNIYLGYGPQSATLTANGTGGSGFTYSWAPGTYVSCTNCANPVFTPTAAGTYVYTVTATNSNGCSTTATVSMCVIDARDPSNSNKVIVCHVPPGNPSNPQTLSISINAVPTHIGNHAGDRLGSCSTVCGAAAKFAKPQDAQVIDEAGLSMVVYPNPFGNEINVDIEGAAGTTANLTIYDMTGRMMEYKPNQATGTSIIVGQNLAAGVYILEVNQNGVSKKVKITKL